MTAVIVTVVLFCKHNVDYSSVRFLNHFSYFYIQGDLKSVHTQLPDIKTVVVTYAPKLFGTTNIPCYFPAEASDVRAVFCNPIPGRSST